MTTAPAETDAHRQLKRLAIAWARAQRFPAIATEVRLPRSGFRADVVAYRRNATAVFECKQARSDFLKDSHSREPTRQRLAALDSRRQKLESLLKLHLPSLRAGETLFAEFDAVNLAGFEHRTYRRVLREIEMLQRRWQGKTKFERLRKYRCANLNYLVVEPGILSPEETPVGWGLLVRRDDALVLERAPIWQEVTGRDRLWLLEQIAVAATRQLARYLP